MAVPYSYRDFGVIIEGVGAVGLSGGVLWTEQGDVLETIFTESDQAVIVKPPNAAANETRWFTGDAKTNALQFSVSATPFAIQALLSYEIRRSTNLVNAVDDSETTLDIFDSGAIPPGRLYWLGNECVEVISQPQQGQILVTRGVCFTRPEAHGDGVYMYTQNPYIDRRRMVAFQTGSDGVTREVWRGFMNEPARNLKNQIIKLSCVSVLAATQGATVNRRNVVMPYWGIAQQLPNELAYLTARTTSPGSPVRKSSQVASIRRWVFGTNDVTEFLAKTQSGSLDFDDAGGWLGSPRPELEDPSTAFANEWTESFIVDRGDDDSVTADLDYPYHPAAIAAAFLASGKAAVPAPDDFDVFDEAWGLGLTPDSLDIAAIAALVEDTKYFLVDRVILGTDGDELPIIPFCKSALLAAFGMGFASTPGGKLSFVRWILPSHDRFYEARTVEPLPKSVDFTWPKDARVTSLSITVGESPWTTPGTYSVDNDLGLAQDSLRRNILRNTKTTSLDLTTMDPGVNSSIPRARALGLISPAQYGQPSFTFTAVFDEPPFIGEFIKLADYEADPAGFRFPVPGGDIKLSTPDVRASGQIYKVKQNFRTNTWHVTMRLPQWHEGHVSGRVSGSGTVLHGQQDLIQLHPSDFALAEDENDGSHFMVGDGVIFTDQSGVQVLPPVIGDFLVIDELTDFPDLYTVIVIFGTDFTGHEDLIMTLAPWPIDPDQTERIPGLETPYAYLANDDGDIPGTPTLEATIYGV